jgi:O-antigen ligase
VSAFVGSTPGARPRVGGHGQRALVVGMAGLLSAAVVEVGYRTSPMAPIVVTCGVVLAALAVTRPLVTLYVAVLLIPLNQISVGFGQVHGITPAEAVFVLTAAGWALGTLALGQLPLMPTPLTKPFLLMLVAVVPGLAVAVDSFIVVKTLVMWSAFFVLFQLVVADGRTVTVRRLLLMLTVSGAAVGVIAVIKASSSLPQELQDFGESATNRGVGAFTQPNQLAGFEAMVLPAAVALLIGGRGARARSVALASAALIIAGLALSLSRGGLVAMAGALVVMLAWRPFRRSVVVAAVSVTVLAVVSPSLEALPHTDVVVSRASIVEQRLSSIGYAAHGVDPRLELWRTTPDIIRDHLPFGVGIGNFPNVAVRYGLVDASGLPYDHAHNLILNVGAELGLLGLVAVAWAAVAMSRLLVRACRRSADPALAFAVAAGLVAFMVEGLVDDLLASNFIAATVTILAGCAVVLSRSVRAAGPAAP